jgi:SpoVK/Ycf46/Vps4 family AAA+-type ATPase
MAVAESSTEDDPDTPVLAEEHARSAILFGPPGTGKTSLVEAVAAGLGWGFIEITPAVFLDQGMEMVSARADHVFRLLMELDHYVVLLDEIDELIQHRRPQAEPLERFFTTTMLPRLAKLWKQRKILFFVNTNSIADVDPAIQRSQRFDSAVLVMPPAFDVKLRELNASGISLTVDISKVEKVLAGVAAPDISPAERDHAWLAFVRWDQLPQIASRLTGRTDDNAVVSAELRRFGRNLAELDWYLPGITEERALEGILEEYQKLRLFQRRDMARVRVVETTPGLPVPETVTVLGDRYWQINSGEDDLSVWAEQNGLDLRLDGRVRSVAVE